MDFLSAHLILLYCFKLQKIEKLIPYYSIMSDFEHKEHRDLFSFIEDDCSPFESFTRSFGNLRNILRIDVSKSSKLDIAYSDLI